MASDLSSTGLSVNLWLLEKERQKRKTEQKEFAQLQKNKIVAEEEIREKKNQLEKANKAYKKWIEEKETERKNQLLIQQKKLAKIKVENEKKAKLTALKSEDCYKKWKLKKYEEEIEKTKRIEAEEIIKAENITEKQLMNKIAFEKWNESIKTRKRDPFVSYMYSSDKLIAVFIRARLVAEK